jgi:cell division protein ZapB
MRGCYPSAQNTPWLDPLKSNPYHRSMDQDLTALEARLERLLEAVRKLSEHNQSLRAELEQARAAHLSLSNRMGDARSRVQAILDRLPAGDGAATLALPLEGSGTDGARTIATH